MGGASHWVATAAEAGVCTPVLLPSNSRVSCIPWLAVPNGVCFGSVIQTRTLNSNHLSHRCSLHLLAVIEVTLKKKKNPLEGWGAGSAVDTLGAPAIGPECRSSGPTYMLCEHDGLLAIPASVSEVRVEGHLPVNHLLKPVISINCGFD